VRDAFRVVCTENYTLITYTMVANDSLFPEPSHERSDLTRRRALQLRRECRGIVFSNEERGTRGAGDSGGQVIARRLHKFFNANTLAGWSLDELPVEREFWILDKLDGCMVAPFLVPCARSTDVAVHTEETKKHGTARASPTHPSPATCPSSATHPSSSSSHPSSPPSPSSASGCSSPPLPADRLVFATRSGADGGASVSVERFLSGRPPHQRYRALCRHLIAERAYTPVFEYLQPDRPIVLVPAAEQLVLLAARHLRTGKYLPPPQLAQCAAEYGVPVVRARLASQVLASNGGPVSMTALRRWYAEVRTQQRDCEGYVLAWFDGGPFVKVKTAWYTHRFHSLANLRSAERHRWRAVLDGVVDDLEPALTAAERASLLQFQCALWPEVRALAHRIARQITDRLSGLQTIPGNRDLLTSSPALFKLCSTPLRRVLIAVLWRCRQSLPIGVLLPPARSHSSCSSCASGSAGSSARIRSSPTPTSLFPVGGRSSPTRGRSSPTRSPSSPPTGALSASASGSAPTPATATSGCAPSSSCSCSSCPPLSSAISPSSSASVPPPPTLLHCVQQFCQEELVAWLRGATE
jgi:RNA ligase